jgi:hypothetical protein
MVTVVIVSYVQVEFGDKVKAKSLLAGEIVILNQNILMIRKYQKGNSKTCFFYRRCRKQSERKYHPGE